jgi:hypothetical protein
MPVPFRRGRSAPMHAPVSAMSWPHPAVPLWRRARASGAGADGK